MAGLDVSQMKSEIESTFSYRKATQTHNTFIQSLQALPLISQLKSLLELLTGNTNAALITQINFSKQCIIVSQLRSLVEASLMNNPKQAIITQQEFLNGPGITHVLIACLIAAPLLSFPKISIVVSSLLITTALCPNISINPEIILSDNDFFEGPPQVYPRYSNKATLLKTMPSFEHFVSRTSYSKLGSDYDIFSLTDSSEDSKDHRD